MTAPGTVTGVQPKVGIVEWPWALTCSAVIASGAKPEEFSPISSPMCQTIANASLPKPLAVGSTTVSAAAVATAASIALPPCRSISKPAAEASAEPVQTIPLRELQEETGYTAETFEFLGEMVPTGAYLEETIQMYRAKGLTFVGTHLDDDEFLNCVKVPLKDVVDQVMRGEIIDGKTIAMTLKLQKLLEEEE